MTWRTIEARRRRDAGAISAADTRTLLALITVFHRDGRATTRAVADESGRTLGNVWPSLQRLRDAGLVDWEPGRAATLHPTVTPVEVQC